MKLYGAIDLHSNNNVTVLIDEQDQVVYQKRLPNDLALITQQLASYRDSLEGIVIESTYNWYWLVDGLMEQGHKIHLANTAAIYPKEHRPVRDLLRKRGQMVRQRTMNLSSIQNLFSRNTGGSMSANRVKRLDSKEIDGWTPARDEP